MKTKEEIRIEIIRILQYINLDFDHKPENAAEEIIELFTSQSLTSKIEKIRGLKYRLPSREDSTYTEVIHHNAILDKVLSILEAEETGKDNKDLIEEQQHLINEYQDEIRRLKLMIDNGVGWKDLENDCNP